MKTITANEFCAKDSEHGPRGKFPHTGPVYYNVGKLPYTAAFKGVELRSCQHGRRVRMFKTAEAATKAITAHVKSLNKLITAV